eukprot:3996693-Amphidinium_carterae.1
MISISRKGCLKKSAKFDEKPQSAFLMLDRTFVDALARTFEITGLEGLEGAWGGLQVVPLQCLLPLLRLEFCLGQQRSVPLIRLDYWTKLSIKASLKSCKTCTLASRSRVESSYGRCSRPSNSVEDSFVMLYSLGVWLQIDKVELGIVTLMLDPAEPGSIGHLRVICSTSV